MPDLSVPTIEHGSTKFPIGNDSNQARPMVVLSRGIRYAVSSEFIWYAEPSDTMLRYGVDEWRAPWTAAVVGNTRLCALDSMLAQQQSNAALKLPEIVSTGSVSLANETHLLSPMEAEEALSTLVGVVMVANRGPVAVVRPQSRYLAPLTPVAERIDELILEDQGQEDVLLDRHQQAEWLKQVMTLYWKTTLPQPFIAFDLEDGLFVASWQSHSECNTLTIDANERKGWYDPWPTSDSAHPMPEEIDLDTEEAWERLRIALTTTRS